MATFTQIFKYLFNSLRLIIRVQPLEKQQLIMTMSSRQSWAELQYPVRRPQISLIGRGASIPRAIFQGRPCSNDTSLRTQHVLAILEQAVLSHAEFVCHLVTNQTYFGVGVP